MSHIPLSVFIIAQDEADRIGNTIRSVVDWVDEVIVIDSGSIDDTVAHSEALGARVLHNAWKGYGAQKRFGESQCRNRWILNLDADEVVSTTLREELLTLFAAGDIPHAGYLLHRVELYNSHKTPRAWSPTTDWLRLYRKDKAGYRDDPVHDVVDVHSGSTGKLRGRLHHHSFRSYAHHIAKINDYSDAQAQNLYRKGKNPSWLKLLLTPPITFLKYLLVRRLIVYGIDGVVLSYVISFHRLARLAKARELHQSGDQQ